MKIDNEFRQLLQPLSPEEYEQLKENIIADGCREPIVLWGDLIVDGHNRYKICTENNIEFDTVQKDFPDRESAMDWIDKNQLGRRNLTPDQMKLIRGRRYNRLKLPNGGDRSKQRAGRKKQDVGATADLIAKESGVSPDTVEKDARFARAVELLPEVKEKIQQGIPVVKKDVIAAAKAIEQGDVEKAKEILDKKPKPINVNTDEVGNELSTEYKELFGKGKEFDNCLKLLSELDKIVKNNKKHPAFAWLPFGLYDPAIRRLREIIRESKPYAICPDCVGQGCERCRNNGFLNKTCFEGVLQ